MGVTMGPWNSTGSSYSTAPVTAYSDVPTPRKKLITASVLLVGLTVLIVAAVTLQRPLRERYWLWRLQSGETQEKRRTAAEKLAELGSVRAVPHLIGTLVAAVERGGNSWWVDLFTSRLSFCTLQDFESFAKVNSTTRLTTFLRPPTFPARTYIGAIESISKSDPERVQKLLRSYLTSENELVRAVAASLLFQGTKRAAEYVSRERVFVLAELQERA